MHPQPFKSFLDQSFSAQLEDISTVNQSMQSDSDTSFLRFRSEHYASRSSAYAAGIRASAAAPRSSLSTTYPSRSYVSDSSQQPPRQKTTLSKTQPVDVSDSLLSNASGASDATVRAQSRKQWVDAQRRAQSHSDRELQEIFKDIGRMTVKLETRLSQSSTSISPALSSADAKARSNSVGSRSSLSGRYPFPLHK
jgi:hypothetical protein